MLMLLQVRVLISDFAVFSAIVLMVLTDFFVGLGTPKLKVPPEFRVKTSLFLVFYLIIQV